MNRLLSRKSLILLAVVAVNLVNALSGLLGETLGEDIGNLLKKVGIYDYRLHITAVLLLAGLAVAVWVSKTEKDEGQDGNGVPESEKPVHEFLADLARRYRKRYEHKMDKRHEISLLVSDEAEGTNSQQSDELIGTGVELSKATQYVIERFETCGRLFLVGSPGSGKTGLLLNLAKYLADKAQKDTSQPLPVIFNIATWSRDYAGFREWVTAMLTKGYGLSPTFAQRLHDEQRLIYLLDGLDELASNEEPARAARLRDECLASIFRLLLHDDSMGAVICCRRDEFDEMIQRTGTKVLVPVLTVHDLSPLRVDRALVRASHAPSDRFASPHLQALLSQDQNGIYYQVLSTPFFFATALQVFNYTERPLIDAPDEERLKANLLAGFVEKKLTVTPNPNRYSHAQTLDRLAWLADFLKGRVTFELSDLQPSTLRRAWLYRLLFCLFCGVIGCLVVGLQSRQAWIALFMGGLFSLNSVYIISEDFGRWTFAPLRRWSTWLISLLFGFVIALLAGFLLLIGMLTEGDAASEPAFPVYAFGMLIVAMLPAGILGFIAALGVRLFIRVAFGIKGGVPLSKIVTEDFSHWTLRSLLRLHKWREVLQSGVEGGVAGLFVVNILGFIVMIAFIVLLIFYMVQGRLVAPKLGELFVGLIMTPIIIIMTGLIGFTIGFIIGILLGIPKVCRETDRFVSIHSPYQRLRAGIFLNILQTSVVGWSFYFLFRLFDLPAYWHGTKEFHFTALLPSLPILLTFGMIGLFRTPLLKHLILRMCLTLEGAMPLHAVSFLNYATDLGILERDGGQWRFRHQILQDHFSLRYRDKESGLTQT